MARRKLHVKLEHEEALEGKKDLLSSQLNILEILKRVKNYRIQRKRELILKGKLKKLFSSLNSEINQALEFFPKEETQEDIKVERDKKKKETSRQKNIESELQDIKDKLTKLS